MFPEAMQENMELSHTQIDPSNPTAVQRLAEPAQMLKNNVIDLINYQDEADVALRAVPELARLLCNSDVQTIHQASIMVSQLTKKEASCYAVMNNGNIVAALVRVATNSNDGETIRHVVGALHNMSHHRLFLLYL